MKISSQNQIDPLVVGLTKAPQFMGVNIRLFFANLSVCSLLAIDCHTLWSIPLFLILHVLLLRLSLKDANFVFIWLKALLKTPPVLNSHFWGKTNSYRP